MPFLVRHGQAVWIILVILSALIVLLIGVRRGIRARHQSASAIPLGLRAAWTIGAAFLAGLAMFLVLRVAGYLALKRAGDHPFADRESDVISALHPVAIAAATPVNRGEALDLIAYAGFALEETCATRLARGRLDELLERVAECPQPEVWTAIAHFVVGKPCEAADALAPTIATSTDGYDLSLAFITQLGCRRFADAARTATRLATINSANAKSWTCVAEVARVKATPTYDLPATACVAAQLVAAQPSRDMPLVRKWLGGHLDLFDIRVRPTSFEPDGMRPVQATTLETMAMDPATYSFVASLERFDGHYATDLLDPLGSISAGNGLSRRAPMLTAAARIADAPNSTELRPVVLADLLLSAAVSDLVSGDFDRARGRLARRRTVLETATADDDGPRQGTLAFAATQTEQMETMIKFRLGQPLELPKAGGEVETAILTVRGGAVPDPNGGFVSDKAVELVRGTLAGDFGPLRREIFRSGPVGRSSPTLLTGAFIAALAPRIRPAPADLLAWVDAPRWSLNLWSPATLAWDAAGRRDVFRLLGEPGRAERWADIARRQWAIATAPEFGLCMGVLDGMYP